MPLGVVVLFSFHSTGGLSFPFEGFSLRWYREVFGDQEFRDALVNSIIVAIATSVVTLVLGHARRLRPEPDRARLRGPLALLFFLPVTLPGLFIGIALPGTSSPARDRPLAATVVLAHLVYVLPYFLLIAVAAFSRLDPPLEEAGADLGATPGRSSGG